MLHIPKIPSIGTKKMTHRFLPLYLFGLVFLLVSCTKEEDPIPPSLSLSESDVEVIRYFKDVALGFEFGNSAEVTRKWEVSMRIFVNGTPTMANRLTLEQAVQDINQLASDGFSIEIVDDPLRSNCYIFFGSGLDFLEIFPDEENNVFAFTRGYFRVWWNNSNVIQKARIIINPNLLTPTQQKSVILEEITQSIGLTNDSPLQPDSVFYETPNDAGYAPEYAHIDRELIRLLYHPKMTVGLDANQAGEVLQDILNNE